MCLSVGTPISMSTLMASTPSTVASWQPLAPSSVGSRAWGRARMEWREAWPTCDGKDKQLRPKSNRATRKRFMQRGGIVPMFCLLFVDHIDLFGGYPSSKDHTGQRSHARQHQHRHLPDCRQKHLEANRRTANKCKQTGVAWARRKLRPQTILPPRRSEHLSLISKTS